MSHSGKCSKSSRRGRTFVDIQLTPFSTTSTISSELDQNIAREIMCRVACIIAAATSTSRGAVNASHFAKQSLRDLGHDRCVARDTARIEGRRHDAAMAAPGLALAGQETAAEPGLKQAAADLGLGVVRGIVQQHVPDRARLVDDEGPPPQNAVRDNVGAEAFGLCVASAFSRMARMNCRKPMRPSGRRGTARTGNSLLPTTVMLFVLSRLYRGTLCAYGTLRLENGRFQAKVHSSSRPMGCDCSIFRFGSYLALRST